jgi:hypothetical protein
MRNGLQVDVVWYRGFGLSCHSIGAHDESSPTAHHALGLTTDSYLVRAKCSTSVARKRTPFGHGRALATGRGLCGKAANAQLSGTR